LNPYKKIIHNQPTINSGNTLEHEMKKCEICYNMKKEGIAFVCEAELQNSQKRPDILITSLVEPICYEVVHSESEDSIKEKIANYPFKIVVVRA